MIPSIQLRRKVALFAATLAACALTNALHAEDAAPTFSDPDVTSFVKIYGEFADQYAASMKTYMADVKSGNTAQMQEDAKKMQANTAKSTELQTKSAAISGKVKPEEAQKFSAYLQKCAQKMADAAKPQ